MSLRRRVDRLVIHPRLPDQRITPANLALLERRIAALQSEAATGNADAERRIARVLELFALAAERRAAAQSKR